MDKISYSLEPRRESAEKPKQAPLKVLDFNLPLNREVIEIHPDTFRSASISAVYRYFTAIGRGVKTDE